MPTTRPLEDRFWEKVAFSDWSGCWEWTAAKSDGGYGRFRTGGRSSPFVVAHRIAYELLAGPIPDGLVIDHLCRNRACVNPTHLEPVTQRVNTLRGVGLSAINAARTHCPQGHPYEGRNLMTTKDGFRQCRACKVAGTQRWRQRLNEHREDVA